jgi:hypothetical protein
MGSIRPVMDHDDDDDDSNKSGDEAKITLYDLTTEGGFVLQKYPFSLYYYGFAVLTQSIGIALALSPSSSIGSYCKPCLYMPDCF